MSNLEHFGFVAIIGRPNVGKSTLMNRFLGKKISITSRKPQTTRHRILGIKTIGAAQIAYVDTPGLCAQETSTQYRRLNRIACAIIQDVDLILLILDVKDWRIEDDWILKQLNGITVPVILVINKIDRLSDRKMLLPFLKKVEGRFDFRAIVPISAKNGDQLPNLEKEIITCLPQSAHGFAPDQWTDRNDCFMASEILREKLMRMLGEELPYVTSVTIEAFEEQKGIIKISALIWVEKNSQKSIVIGKQGTRLKDMVTKARKDMEKYFEKKVFLQTWVKVGIPKME